MSYRIQRRDEIMVDARRELHEEGSAQELKGSVREL